MRMQIVNIRAILEETHEGCGFMPDPFAEDIYCEDFVTKEILFWDGHLTTKANFCDDHEDWIGQRYERKEMDI